jgi:hypothetical protein
MSAGAVLQRITFRIKEMMGLPATTPIDPEVGLGRIAEKFVMMHGERVLAHAAFSMMVLLANGPPELDEKGQLPEFFDVLCGVAWDFGAHGYERQDLDVVFRKLEQQKVQAPARGLVALH